MIEPTNRDDKIARLIPEPGSIEKLQRFSESGITSRTPLPRGAGRCALGAACAPPATRARPLRGNIARYGEYQLGGPAVQKVTGAVPLLPSR